MKKLVHFFLFCFLFFATQGFCDANEKMSFWQTPQNGTNYDESLPIVDPKFATYAKKNNCSFIYSTIYGGWRHDVRRLNYITSLLNYARKNNLKVVVALPVIACIPEMNYEDALREEWTKIVNKLKDCPEVVAYSIPSFKSSKFSESFHKKVVTEIRKIDPSTPIILRWKNSKMDAIKEKNILYGFGPRIVCPEDQDPNGEPNSSVIDALNQQFRQAKGKLNSLGIWAKQNGVLPEQILISYYGTIWGYGPALKIDKAELDSFLEIIKANGWHRSYTYDTYMILK